jgi:hypothetical protein
MMKKTTYGFVLWAVPRFQRGDVFCSRTQDAPIANNHTEPVAIPKLANADGPEVGQVTQRPE